MTVKKRLEISNIIMIVVPVLVTAIIGLLCLGGVYITAHYSGGFGFDSTQDFYNISKTLSGEMNEIFDNDGEDVSSSLNKITNVVNRDTMLISAYEDGAEVYKNGNEGLADKTLIDAAKNIGGNTFVSSQKCQLYYYSENINGKNCELYIFSMPVQTNGIILKASVAVSVILVALAVFLSVFLTNRFLTKFAIKRIEMPLDLLSDGVEKISRGNLDCRIEYDGEDEFKPVCEAFNEMAAMLKMSVEASQKNEQNRKELLLGISHDLRSPLTSIQAYVEGILDGVASTPEMQKKYLETVKRKTKDIEKMVSALFAYSKLDVEENAVNSEIVNISQFMAETAKNLCEEYSQNGLNISTEINDDLYALADRDMLIRISGNLLGNSLKYKNGKSGNAKISVYEKNGKTVIEFSDDGLGVPENCYDDLFEIFYRTDKARSNTGSGSGIGLAFVKKAVELMNGSVYARKSDLGGLSIIIELEKAYGQDTDN